MNYKTDLQLCFKGERTYLHGTDMFNAVCPTIEKWIGAAVSDITMSFHRVIRNQPVLELTSSASDRTAATVRFRAGDLDQIAHLKETDAVVSCRYPYDEDSIVAAAQLRGHEIRLERATGFTLVEEVVALNKGLATSVFRGAGGKWFLSRLVFDHYRMKRGDEPLKVVLSSSQTTRLTKSAVYLGDHACGFVMFTLVSGA
jgi:hypothetical protein